MSASHLIGQKVGEYEVTRRIGMGGMGAVYEGKHPLIGKKVAIKVLQPQFSEDEAQMKRFLSEAVAVNEIRHRGIVDIFGFGSLPDGSSYIIMEYLEGMSFEQLLKTRRSLPPAEALGLLEEVLDAVAAAHQAQIVHRDLKPSNLFLVDIGRGRPFVKLLDFGVAKLSRGEGARKAEATGIVGTPIYMSPEQVNGLRAGPEADIYALGVVLFELIAGRPPFKADNPVEMMTRHLDQKPPKLSEVKAGVPSEVDRLVDRMLSKRPQDRPQDAEELRAEVARLRSRIDLPIRRGAPAQKPLDEDVGPTVVRVVKRGATGATTPDITPIENRTVGRVDFNERTQIANPNKLATPELVPWTGNTPVATLDTGDSDPDLLSARPTMVGAPPQSSATRVTAEQPMLDGESPVPTVPIKPFSGPMPTFEKASDRKLPVAKLTSQSSPTLSAADYAEADRILKSEFSVTDPGGRPMPTTDRVANSGPHRDTAPPQTARQAEEEQKKLGAIVLAVGLIAAAIVGLAVFVIIGAMNR